MRCPDCDSDQVTDTGCPADGCGGWACVECAWGCTQIEQDGGACERALYGEGPEVTQDRLNAERAAFGLPPLTAEGERVSVDPS